MTFEVCLDSLRVDKPVGDVSGRGECLRAFVLR